MSWNPLKKLQRHGSKSHLVQRDEVELEKHVTKLEQLENTTKKLLKDAKKYEDCIVATNHSEKKLTSDLSNSLLCQEEEERLRDLVQEWHSYVSQATDYDDDLVLVTQRTVVEPIKKFQGVFSTTRSALKKRDQAIQDCVKASQKVQKLEEKEKTGPNIVKLEAAKQNLANHKEESSAQDALLKLELPLLYEGRIEYFQPCLESLMKAQVEYSGNCVNLFSEAIPSLKNFTDSEADMRQVQKSRLDKIHALSIVGEN